MEDVKMKLENKTVIVTGASSGMGEAITKLFVKNGANVVAVARRKEKLEALLNELSNEKGKLEIFAGDISLKETNEKMIDFALEKFGSFDILVNNAGVMDDMSPVGNITDEMYERVMKTNFYGPMWAMNKAVNVFKENKTKGNIINISSVGGSHTCAGAIYCASKAALNSLTKNTAYMYMPDGIRVNAIAPGGIKTNISSSMGMPNMDGYNRAKTVIACSPELGEASEIATAALFLASDDASYVNGVILPVDGGWTSF